MCNDGRRRWRPPAPTQQKIVTVRIQKNLRSEGKLWRRVAAAECQAEFGHHERNSNLAFSWRLLTSHIFFISPN
jgi:hypothetical protein